jgi:thiol-disulfide isomerase/thioredoxin
MNQILLQRRKFLSHLSLGIFGAGLSAIANFATNSGGTAEAASMPGNQLPEFQGISQWLNSPPLTTKDLKSNVVLIQFWTFSCINCQRTLPYVTGWHQKYGTKGLKIIGVHTPEFAFERDANNIRQALKKHGIVYPVPMDNEFKTWNAYSNQYWPHLFLADRQGVIRYDHIGEGAYDKTEETIRRLLG